MTENKRFILFDDKETIIDKKDNETYWTFECIQLEKLVDVLNELAEENEQLKSDNFNLNKSVECLDETVKEQCNKIDWADECGVRWEEEYEKWKG